MNKEESLIYIQCFPVNISKKLLDKFQGNYPPTDDGQTGYRKEPCPKCNQLMWTTDKKREWRKKFPDAAFTCSYCIPDTLTYTFLDISNKEDQLPS